MSYILVLNPFCVNFVSGVRWGVQFSFFACEYSVFSTQFIEETILPPLSILGSTVNYELTMYVWQKGWTQLNDLTTKRTCGLVSGLLILVH